MILKKDSPQQLVVNYLARSPRVTAGEIKAAVEKKFGSYSPQGIYRILRTLEKEGIILHEGKYYQLRKTWAYEVRDLYEQLEENYFSQPTISELYSGEKRQLTWKFSDLKKADGFWIQLMLELLRHELSDLMFLSMSHPWFYLLNYEEDLRFQEVLKNNGWKLYLALSNETFLSRSFLQYWNSDVYISSFAPLDFELEDQLYLTVIGDYVLEIDIGDELAEKLDTLFFETQSFSGNLPGRVLEIATQYWDIKVKLKRAPKVAKRLLSGFHEHFLLPKEQFKY